MYIYIYIYIYTYTHIYLYIYMCVQDQWTPLHWAALNGKNQMAKQLIDAKADVHVHDEVCVAVFYSVLQCVAVCCQGRCPRAWSSVRCRFLQCVVLVALCCSALQCVAKADVHVHNVMECAFMGVGVGVGVGVGTDLEKFWWVGSIVGELVFG